MTMIEFLTFLGIENPTEKSMLHPKMKQFLDYCNKMDSDLYEHSFSIQEDAFLTLLETIHSMEKLLSLLKMSHVLLNINYSPKEIATYYNLYSIDFLPYSEDTKILMDEEYLKYATVEWTEKEFLAKQKVLVVLDDHLSFKIPHPENEEEEVESYLLNLVALKEAKEKNLLKEAITLLS